MGFWQRVWEALKTFGDSAAHIEWDSSGGVRVNSQRQPKGRK